MSRSETLVGGDVGEAGGSGSVGSSRDAFAAWVTPSLPAVRLLAARWAPADSGDVVQESLLRAWQRWSTYDAARGTPTVWLLHIVADRARRARVVASRRIDRGGGRTGPIGIVPAPEPDVDLERALERLTARQRAIVDCFYFVGLTVDQTAAVAGCSVGTVKSTLSDARTKLRMLLEENTDDRRTR